MVDVIEAMNTHTEIAMCKLLKALYDAIIITPEMMEKVCIHCNTNKYALIIYVY